MKFALYVLLGLAVLLLLGAQLGLLQGRRPDNLGLRDGKLKPPSKTPNSVSSQAALWPEHPQSDYAQIAPFALKPAGAAASMRALEAALKAMPGVTVVESRPDYILAQAQTKLLKYVDDLEFALNADKGVIDLRSASRLGRKDFGVNRQRIEALRTAYTAAP